MRFPIWPRPSTRAFMREARRLPGYSLFDWLHGYVYRALGIPVHRYRHGGPSAGETHQASDCLLDHLINSRADRRPAAIVIMPDGAQRPVGFADTYHGKVVTLAAATQLVTVKKDLNLGDLEHIVPTRRRGTSCCSTRPYRRHGVSLPRRACTTVRAYGRLPGRR